MLRLIMPSLAPLDPKLDPHGRPCHGWAPGMTDSMAFELNRYGWDVNLTLPISPYPNVERRTFALFCSDGVGRFAAEIFGTEDAGGQQALQGVVLDSGHPVFDAFVDARAPVVAGSPVGYFMPKITCSERPQSDGAPCTRAARWIIAGWGQEGLEHVAACGYHAGDALDHVTALSVSDVMAL